jgi:hypothetical protein
MFSAAIVIDLNGVLDWMWSGETRFATADEVWRTVGPAGSVLRWEGYAAVELIVDGCCARCPGPAGGFLIGTDATPEAPATRLCNACAVAVPPAQMLRWVTMERAAVELGVPVRPVGPEDGARIRHERALRAALDEAEATLIGAELAGQIAGAGWRAEVVVAAAGNPRIAAHLAASVAALDQLTVLDLYPGLAALGQALPGAVRRALRATRHGRVATARLGLPRA